MIFEIVIDNRVIEQIVCAHSFAAWEYVINAYPEAQKIIIKRIDGLMG